MSLQLEPLKPEEVDEFIGVQWAAFDNLDMIMPMIYPLGLQDDLMTRLRRRHMNDIQNNPDSFYFGVRDPETRQMISVSCWDIQTKAKTNAEMDEDHQKSNAVRLSGVEVAGMNRPLGDAFFNAAASSKREITGGRPNVCLNILATHPDHHRRGAGAVHLKWGIEQADKLDLPIYLDSSVLGRKLYERNGFKVVKDFPFDGREWGGRSKGEHWCMVRPAQRGSSA